MTGILYAESDPVPDKGKILIQKLNVRAEPGTKGRIIGVLTKGAQVPILGYEDGWYKVRFNRKTGYIRASKRYIIGIGENNKVISHSGEGSAPELSRYQKEADQIHRQIQTARDNVVSYTEKETEVINTLNEIDLSLDTARKQVHSFEKDLTVLEKQIETSQTHINRFSEDIKKTEAYAFERLVSLYKLSWLGETHMLASAESLYDIICRQRALERILQEDEQVLNDLWQKKHDLQELLEEQNTNIGRHRQMEMDLNRQVEELTNKRRMRSELLANIRNQKSLEMAAIDALSRAAEELTGKITSLSRSHPSDSGDHPAGDVNRKPFSLLKGLLNMPVKGKVVSTFGPYHHTEFNVMNFRSGIDIKADRGEPIHAVYAGKVLYASWFKGYGNMMIIDHGDNYYTVYANIEELFKSPGDLVQKDEVVATVGDGGSTTGSKLYFEVRHHGKPMDPLAWLKKG